MCAARGAAASRSPAVDKKKQFFFLHGDDEAAIENFKSRIVDAHLTQEMREENYREVIPGAGAGGLRKVLGDVLSELSTVSFLPTAKRIVTLYTVNDFFEARATKAKGRAKAGAAKAEPKKSSSEHLAQFIESELPNLPAVLIVIALEDYEKWKKVAPANPVYALAQKMNTVHAFKESSPQFAFFDALFARNTQEALRLWRDWLERASGTPKPYYQLASQVRLLIQAKTASSGQLNQRGITRERFAKEFLPNEFDKNLFMLRPEFRQEKMLRAASNFSFSELLDAYEKLEPLQRYAIPLQSDPYVPDKKLLSELWIIGFTAGRND